MSKRYRFVALVNAKPGAEDAFDAWLTDQHIPHVVRAAGFTRGERMTLVDGTNGEATAYRYLVIFEGEGDHPEKALERLAAAVTSGEVDISETLGAPIWSSLYVESSDKAAKS